MSSMGDDPIWGQFRQDVLAVFERYLGTLPRRDLGENQDVQRRGDAQNRTLSITIRRVTCPLTMEALRQVFAPYGMVEKIEMPQKSMETQVWVQYRTRQNAISAISALQGRNIYDGCCQMDIQLNDDVELIDFAEGKRGAGCESPGDLKVDDKMAVKESEAKEIVDAIVVMEEDISTEQLVTQPRTVQASISEALNVMELSEWITIPTVGSDITRDKAALSEKWGMMELETGSVSLNRKLDDLIERLSIPHTFLGEFVEPIKTCENSNLLKSSISSCKLKLNRELSKLPQVLSNFSTDMFREYRDSAIKFRNRKTLVVLKEPYRFRLLLMGVREYIFTGSVTSLAWFMSAKGTCFVTLAQCVLATSLLVTLSSRVKSSTDVWARASKTVMLLGFVPLGCSWEEKARIKIPSDMNELLSLISTQSRLVITLSDTYSSADSVLSYDAIGIEVPSDDIRVGDLVSVLPGETIIIEGKVFVRRSMVDESLLTGESCPVFKEKCLMVSAGAINWDSPLRIEVTLTCSNSIISKIIYMVEDVPRQEAPVQRLEDAIARPFVYSVMTQSVATFVFWYYAWPHRFSEVLLNDITGPDGNPWLSREFAVDVLVVSYPCVLGFAIPTVILVGSSFGTRQGLLIRGADVLEHLANIKPVGFEKTGILTKGKPTVSVALFIVIPQMDAAVERTTHPITNAIVKRTEVLNLTLPEARRQLVEPGFGNLAEFLMHELLQKIHKGKGQALVEFFTPEEASAALSFDDSTFSDFVLKIRQPKEFVEVSVEPEKSRVAITTVKEVVEDSHLKILIGGVSKALPSEMFVEIANAFGLLKAYYFDINLDLEAIFTAMLTIMSLVLEESKDISMEMLSSILDSVKKDNEEVSPVARRWAEKMLKNGASKLQLYLTQAAKNLRISYDDYSSVLASVCQERAGTLEQTDAATGKHVDDESIPAEILLEKTAHEAVKTEQVDLTNENSSKTVVCTGTMETAEDDSLANSKSLKKEREEKFVQILMDRLNQNVQGNKEDFANHAKTEVSRLSSSIYGVRLKGSISVDLLVDLVVLKRECGDVWSNHRKKKYYKARRDKVDQRWSTKGAVMGKFL